VKFTVNGHERETTMPMSVSELLAMMKLDPRFLAVERNRELVPRSQHAECRLEEGDEIEIVTLVGGG
jgi:thiamine biosynthesis protein ThiS